MAIGGHHVFVLNWYHFCCFSPPPYFFVALLRRSQCNNFLSVLLKELDFFPNDILFFRRKTRGLSMQTKKYVFNLRTFPGANGIAFSWDNLASRTPKFSGENLLLRISVPLEFCDFERIGSHFRNWTMLDFFGNFSGKFPFHLLPFRIFRNLCWREFVLSSGNTRKVVFHSPLEIKNETGVFRRMDSAKEKLIC